MDEVDPSPSPQTPRVEVVTLTPRTVPDEPEFIGQQLYKALGGGWPPDGEMEPRRG